METIRVNMTPCDEVKTIHASQNDGEARQWGFELHNNGDVIDSSEVTDQMVFKAYKGGAEQLLPENTSTPTTSPFKGDIRYPQGILSDQEFTYRQSPTEEDGYAKITDIKGNTIVWNQLANVGTLSAIASYSGYLNIGTFSFVANHKYLIKYHQDNTMASNTRNTLQVRFATVGQTVTENATANAHLSQGDYSWLFKSTYTDTNTIVRFWVADNDVSVSYSNIMLIDLTQMGLDITDPSDFTSLFPLSYYSYNQGSLLSFNGNGIKTVGKNLFDFSQFANGTITFENGVLNGTGAQFHVAYGTYATAKKLNCPKGSQITISFDAWTDQNATSSGNGLIIATYHYDGTHEDAMVPNATGTPRHFTLQRQDIEKIGWSYGAQGANRWHVKNFQVEFGTETEYEPYTSSTLSLPISTYFPNGMDGVGTAYDELTNTKASKRMTRVDLGTLSFFYNSSSSFFYATIPNLVNGMTYATESPNVMVQNYEYKGGGVGWANMPNMSYGFNGQDIRIKNTAYTSSAEFVNAVRGTYMVYELATYEETSFTTVSLVTENGEVALANENGVLVGRCNSDISADAGFIEGKIKLSDEDGDVYSSKIQIHVERSPQ